MELPTGIHANTKRVLGETNLNDRYRTVNQLYDSVIFKHNEYQFQIFKYQWSKSVYSK